MKNGDEYAAASSLKKIDFDIVERDTINGNNVFHYILQEGNKNLWDNLFLMLKNIVQRLNPEKINIALSCKNKYNKTPYECALDSEFLKKVKNDIDVLSIQQSQPISITSGNNLPISISSNTTTEVQRNFSSIKTQNVTSNDEKLVGNEIIDEIDDDLNFDNFSPAVQDKIVNNTKILQPDGEIFGEVIGLIDAKKVLKDFIVQPIKNKTPILVNGILLHGIGNNGKTYLVNSLCEYLGKEITSTRKILTMLDDTNQSASKIEKILDKNAVSISINDYLEIDNIIDYIKDNYKKTGKQTIVFIDELAKFFQQEQNRGARYSQRDIPELIRKFDNFSLNGGVLIGTTNDIDFIQEDLLRSNRFQIKMELKFPQSVDREELFEKYFGNKLQISEKDFAKIIKKTAGFSFGDLSVLARILEVQNSTINFEILNNAIEKYAKDNKMGELSEEGTTSNYDTKFLSREKIDTDFSDVAGLDEIKRTFRNTIINRLTPEVRKRFKEDNNRQLISSNFLLYGPPGTGKTYIVKALAGESKLPMYMIDASSFLDSYLGASEKNLKRIFNQLETKFKETGEYSILFIDEANKILGKRDSEVVNSSDSRYVEQLLQYIENSGKKGIITITATNFKDKMDDAVLSRLGEQMFIGFPSLQTITHLTKLLFNQTKTASTLTDKDIEKIACRLQGFGSREIQQIINQIIDKNLDNTKITNPQVTLDMIETELAEYAKSKGLPIINDRNKTSGYDKFIKRTEILSTDPQTLDDIGGMKETKERLLSAIMAQSQKPEIQERYKKNKVKSQNGILLYGEPGCGKTYIMKAFAAHMNLPLYEFKMSQFGSKWAHQTTENIGKIFKQLKEKYVATGERSILMIDEFEDVAADRSSEPNNFRVEETNTLLKEISDAEKNGIIIVAATNYYDKIDTAMKRPGRFVSIEVKQPDFDARKDIIKKTLRGREIADKIFDNERNFEMLANETNNFAIVDITVTIEELIKKAIDDNIDKLSLPYLQNAFKNRAIEKQKQQKTKEEY